jgi:uncharacterized membrane protein
MTKIPGQAVGTSQAIVSLTPTIDTNAYADGDALGGKLTFADAVIDGANSGLIVAATLIDDAKQNAPIDVFLFAADFTPTADNAAWNVSAADLEKCIGVISIGASDYRSGANRSVASVTALALPIALAPPATSLFAQMVSRATPTYGASDVTLKLHILQD